MNRQSKLNSLQIVRAAAYIGILCQHCNTIQMGAWSVTVFLVLSGFLMVYNYKDAEISCGIRNQIRFSSQKIRKMYPLHLVMMLVALPLTVIPLVQDFSENAFILLLLRILTNLFLWQSWVPNSNFCVSLNGVAWYLSTVAFSYFVFPLLLKQFQVRGKPFAAVLFSATILLQAAASMISYRLEVPTIPLQFITLNVRFHMYVTYIFPVFRLGDFCIGCCLGYLFCHCRSRTTPFTATLLEVLSAVLAAASIMAINFNEYVRMIRFSMLYLPSAALMIWIFAVNRGYISRLLSTEAVVRFGDLSGCAFLIHYMAVQYLKRAFSTLNTQPWLLFFLALTVTDLLARMYTGISRKRRDEKQAFK